MQETWVRSLGQEDPLEKEMATYSSILAWEIPRTEEPGGLQFMGLQRVGHDLVTEHSPRRGWHLLMAGANTPRCVSYEAEDVFIASSTVV